MLPAQSMSAFHQPIDLTVHLVTTPLIETKVISGFSSGQSQVPVSNNLGGCLVIVLLAIYVWVGMRYREYHIRKATNRLQQIDTVERILKRQN